MLFLVAWRKHTGTYKMGEAASYVNNLVEVHKELLRAYNGLSVDNAGADGIMESTKGYWHTDLSKAQIEEVKKRILLSGNLETTKITDTAHWYKGRIGGRDIFVIYSTEDTTDPTILYEVKGGNALLELDILTDLLEEIENGESIDRKSAYVDWVSGGGWLQKVNNSQNNLGNLGSGQNNRNVGVLQRQSQRNGSRAFWNVLENLFERQEQDGVNSEFSEEKSSLSAKYSFAGTKAATADMSALERAESMEQGKATEEEILRETGWYRGADGKWRFELDDSVCSLIDDPKLEKHTYDGETYFTAKLEDILKHDKLFESYPHLRNTNVIIQETDFGTNGISFAERNEIVLSKKLYEKLTEEYLDIVNNRQKYIAEIEATPEYKKYNSIYDKEFSDAEEWLKEEERLRNEFYSSDLGKRYHSLMWPRKDSSIQMYEPGWSNKAKEVLLHEVQHLIQAVEGFARGSSNGYWVRKGATIREADDLYYNTAGEIEARDASERMDMTEAERRESMPNRGDENTVFADDIMISFDEGNKKTADEAVEETIFSPDGNTVEKFSEQVDDWLRGNMPTNGMFELGKTPEVLKKLGVKDLPMVMSQEVIAKVTGGKHVIAIDDIKKLPGMVANPIMVFKSATIDNAFVLLTEIVDKAGNDVIVAMHLNRSEKHVRVNRVASMYGKKNIEAFVLSQINAGNLKYIDKNKSLSWSQSRGLQLPKLADTTRGSNNSILTKEDIVNRYYGQKDEALYSISSPDIEERSSMENRAYEIETAVSDRLSEMLEVRLTDATRDAVKVYAISTAMGDEARIRASLEKLTDSIIRNEAPEGANINKQDNNVLFVIGGIIITKRGRYFVISPLNQMRG